MIRRRQGISLHIGLNRVDPAHYAGWSGELRGCHIDAAAMEEIAARQGYEPRLTLLDEKATVPSVQDALRSAAGALKADDTILITFAGHGGQVPDLDGDEEDGMDETLCLYDRQWIDDEIRYELTEFAPGVRILLIADSCHSGSVSRSAIWTPPRGFTARILPPGLCTECYQEHRSMYDRVQVGAYIEPNSSIMSATAILLSACQDNQLAGEDEGGGIFTQALRSTWSRWRRGSVRRFRDAIAAQLPPWQTPQYSVVGPTHTAFETTPPFVV